MLLLFATGLFIGVFKDGFTLPSSVPFEHRTGIHASSDCYEQDSSSVRVGIFGINKEAILDTDCEKREAARLAAEAGMTQHTRKIVCNLAGTLASFNGDERACLEYTGDYSQVLVDTVSREVYCDGRSKKWYRRVSFNVKAKYRRCMREQA
jgi:hypothetical protein